LSVSNDIAVGGVDTRIVGVLGVARFEDIVLRVVGGIESAANAVENVLTEFSSVGSGRVTGLQAESIAAHEAKGIVNSGYTKAMDTYLVHSTA